MAITREGGKQTMRSEVNTAEVEISEQRLGWKRSHFGLMGDLNDADRTRSQCIPSSLGSFFASLAGAGHESERGSFGALNSDSSGGV